MAMLGFNLDEAEYTYNEINKLKEIIKNNESYRKELMLNSANYKKVKAYLKELCSFLMYRCDSIKAETNFYRVRQLKDNQILTSKQDLLYPPQDKTSSGRMNNKVFNVMYASLNEFTACMEANIHNCEVNDKFQLTRFKCSRDLNIYRLGTFSEIYFNLPRDSDVFNERLKHYNIPTQSTLKGFSALENILLEILYSKEDNNYLLSSILAHAIFEKNDDYSTDRIDAILYPSQQSLHGVNFAFKTRVADELEVSFTSVNKVSKIYSNKMISYHTLQECLNINEEKIIYENVRENSTWR